MKQTNVPDGWKEVKLGDIAEITSGSTPSRDKPEYWGGDIPWVKTTQIQNCHISKNSIDEYITKKGFENSSLKIIPKGTILMAMYGQGKTRGQIGILDVDATTNQACAAIQNNKNTDTNFLYQLLLNNYDDIRKLSNTGGQQNLSGEIIRTINIIMPPLAEQKAIAEMLSVWDNMIEKMEQLIAKKKEVFNSLENYFFSSNKSTKIKHKIGEFVVSRNEQCIPSQTIPLYSLTIEDGITAKTDRYNRESLVNDIASKKYKIVYPGDIVFNPANLRWGAIARSKQNIKVAVSPIYEVLSVSGESVNPSYLAYYLTSKCQVKFYATKTEGTLIERMAVKIDAFVLFDVYIEEEINRQKEIVNILNCAEEEIDKLKQLVAQYKLQKQGLMQKLITGQWRIK